MVAVGPKMSRTSSGQHPGWAAERQWADRVPAVAVGPKMPEQLKEEGEDEAHFERIRMGGCLIRRVVEVDVAVGQTMDRGPVEQGAEAAAEVRRRRHRQRLLPLPHRGAGASWPEFH